MSRYAKANQTIDDLKALIRKSTAENYLDDDGEGCPYGIICSDEAPKATQDRVCKDLSKIEVDTENVDYIDEYELPGTESLDRFEMIGAGETAFPVAWCTCAGDWENPLAFVLYIGQKGELRAYIPKDGNFYDKKKKAAYDADPDTNPPDVQFDADKLRADVAGRIMVKGAVEDKKKKPADGITFRQLIQSLKNYDDQCTSVMPYADGAENACWGIQYIWFADGILYLGQHDDEGLHVGLIVEKIEECLPKEMLDKPAVVKVGVHHNSSEKQLVGPNGNPVREHHVVSSEVKPATSRIGEDDEFYYEDDEYEDEIYGTFCKWDLKFA